MLSLDTDTDTLNLEGMSPSCEHEQHDACPEWHADGDERYVMLSSPCGHTRPELIRVYCRKWLTVSDLLKCPSCPEVYPLKGNYTDLGPVSSFHG